MNGIMDTSLTSESRDAILPYQPTFQSKKEVDA